MLFFYIFMHIWLGTANIFTFFKDSYHAYGSLYTLPHLIDLFKWGAGKNGLPSKKSQITFIFSGWLLTESCLSAYWNPWICLDCVLFCFFTKNTLSFILFQSPENIGRLPYGVMEWKTRPNHPDMGSFYKWTFHSSRQNIFHFTAQPLNASWL